MPLWLIYGAEYLMAVALFIIALLLLGWACGFVHFMAVDDRIAGAFTTHYLLVVGGREQAKLAVIQWVVSSIKEARDK
jgi:uncharacterized membrane protein